LEFLSEAVEHATLHRLNARLPEISIAFVKLHIAAGAFDKASEALYEAAKHPMNEGNAWARDEIYCNEARLALENGDIPRAAAAFDCIASPSSTFSVARKGYYLSLEIRIRLAQQNGLDGLATLVSELERTHCQMRGLGQQDFESYALFLGLCHIGQSERGATLLREYVNEHRRSRWPLAQSIRDSLSPHFEFAETEKLDVLIQI